MKTKTQYIKSLTETIILYNTVIDMLIVRNINYGKLATERQTVVAKLHKANGGFMIKSL